MERNEFSQVVRSKKVKWAVVTTCSLVFITALQIGFLSLLGHFIFGTSNLWTPSLRILSLVGLSFTALSLFLGQVTHSLLIQGWDTWISQLGPHSIRILISVLEEVLGKLEE